MGRIAALPGRESVVASAPDGSESVTVTVAGSTTVTAVTFASVPFMTSPAFIRSIENLTSSAVIGEPSLNLMPGRRWKV